MAVTVDLSTPEPCSSAGETVYSPPSQSTMALRKCRRPAFFLMFLVSRAFTVTGIGSAMPRHLRMAGRTNCSNDTNDDTGRITSYNVCYTKLLRGEPASAGRKNIPNYSSTNASNSRLFHRFRRFEQPPEGPRLLPNSVITSYSIHYTKLYDRR